MGQSLTEVTGQSWGQVTRLTHARSEHGSDNAHERFIAAAAVSVLSQRPKVEEASSLENV